MRSFYSCAVLCRQKNTRPSDWNARTCVLVSG
nr:MAG TPA: Protein of unknown function (DUF3579) [Caudoviricetes sp.]